MKTLRALLPFIRPYRRRLLLAVSGMGFFTFLILLPPLVMRYLLDEVAATGAWHRLPLVVLGYSLIPIVAHSVRFLNVRLIMLAASRLIGDIRTALYRKILGLSMRYHGRHSAGVLVSRMMDDVNMLQNLLTGESVSLVVDAVIIIFALWVTFSISVFLSLLMCGVVALYLVAYRIFSKTIRTATKSHRQIFDQIAGRLQETVAGARHVRIYNREEWENAAFLERQSESLDRALESGIGSVNLSTACTAISGFGSTLVLGLGAFLVLKGKLSYGELSAFLAYLWMLIGPVVRLTTLAGQLSATFVSVERIARVLGEEEEIRSRPGAPRLTRVKGSVEFRDVHFSYDPKKPLFEGLSLRVEAGKTIALVGETGCGKTTLTALLMRQWDVQRGAVLVDGHDVRDVDLRSLRAQFGVVLQDPVVLEGTLAENIAYGAPGAPRARIEEAARAAEVSDLALRLPKGFDTVISGEGVKLSVGEKQRISIARAILKDPAILVLDEATSSLDSHSEALIQKAMSRILRGRTSFVVAHRLSTIVSADQIVVLDQGRIVETGTHLFLMKLQGLYRRLYEQLRGEARGGRRAETNG